MELVSGFGRHHATVHVPLKPGDPCSPIEATVWQQTSGLAAILFSRGPGSESYVLGFLGYQTLGLAFDLSILLFISGLYMKAKMSKYKSQQNQAVDSHRMTDFLMTIADLIAGES